MYVKEIVFYIHGVSPDTTGKRHTDRYETLHDGVARSASPSLFWPKAFGGAEWGWNFENDDPPKGHKALADAQRRYGRKVLGLVGNEKSDWLYPWHVPGRLGLNRLRSLIMYGLGDMFYYVSFDGKWQIRYGVGRQLHEYVQSQVGRQRSGVSLTLLGHSAGSVIAFDFLYYIFSDHDPWERVGSRWKDLPGKNRVIRGLKSLRQMRQNGRLRLRRLITFGSPISFLIFRSNWLVERLERKQLLSPADHGLESSLEGWPLDGPRWINLWDKDDPIAWPVEPLMESPLVEDVYVDISDSVSSAHTAYWSSKACHDAIAARW